MKKAKKIFKGLTKGHTSILLKFYNFFALCGPFGLKNIANRRNLTPKAIKAKKADIKPNVSATFKLLRTHLLRTVEEVRKIEMHNLPARNKTIRDLTLAIANMADIDMIMKNSKVRKATTSQGTISWLFRAATPDIKNV